MSDKPNEIPNAIFAGDEPGLPITPRDERDDDEQLAETPPDVIMMLGFDPADPDFLKD